jgi:hypothetical protein
MTEGNPVWSTSPWITVSIAVIGAAIKEADFSWSASLLIFGKRVGEASNLTLLNDSKE